MKNTKMGNETSQVKHAKHMPLEVAEAILIMDSWLPTNPEQTGVSFLRIVAAVVLS